MPYGYIPSPLGGRPSSLDIAKAAKRDKENDIANARKTPQSRANKIDNDRFVDEFISGKDPDVEQDRGRPPTTVLDDRRATKLDSDVSRAKKTPIPRAVNQGVKRMSDLAGGERLPTYLDVDQEVSRAPSERFSGVSTLDKSEDESEDGSGEAFDENQIEVIDTKPPYYSDRYGGGRYVDDNYKFKTIEGKKHDDATLGAMRTPRMKAEITGGERLPDESQSESYYAEWVHPVENTPKGRDKKALDAKLPTPWGKDSYARQSATSDESLYDELDEDRRDSIEYDSMGYDVRNDIESTRKSESSPVVKSINQMIYDRTYGRSPYSIRK